MSSISIIICTYNRASDLRETLRSLARVERPANILVEILVVDNASTDETRSVTEAAAQENAGLRYLYEGRRGKVHSLNRALDEANGEFLVFTDDDLRFPTNWLTATYAPLWEGKVDAVSGGITLAPHLKKPWMNLYFELQMASTECYEDHKNVELVGANMGFARHVLEKVPRFDTELGPGALGVGEETLFSHQLKQAGFHIAGSFTAKVVHHFNPQRLRRSQVLRHAEVHGRSAAYRAYHWEYRTFPRNFYRHFVGCAFHLAKWRMFHLTKPQHDENISTEELYLVESYSYFKQLVKESKRERNYTHRGLVKRNSKSPIHG